MNQNYVFTFCFAGILDGSKESLDTIVKAYGRLEPGKVRLNIIGVTEKDFCDFYKQGAELIARCENEINFMGRFSHEETIKHVANCDCYIFIRQSDVRNNAGFPTKFSESFTCGVPIVTTDISDIRDYMTEDRGRVLDSVSIDDVETAIKAALSAGQRKNKPELSAAFHYGNYVEAVDNWLNTLLL
jgi:glycosyltransferase involved in cell wall biosynthesis